MPEKDKTPEKSETREHEGFVKVTKGKEVLHVHPVAVAAHKEAGWTVHR